MKRGLIVPSAFEIDRPRRAVITGGVSEAELRRLVLYWDKVATLRINALGATLSNAVEEQKILLDSGILCRLDLFIPEEVLTDAGAPAPANIPQETLGELRLVGGEISLEQCSPKMLEAIDRQIDRAKARGTKSNIMIAGFALEQMAVAHRLGSIVAHEKLTAEEGQSCRWSIGLDPTETPLIGPSIKEAGGLEVQLVNALPVPAPDVPIARILAYKEKYNADLLALRGVFASFVDRVTTAADPERETSKVMAELEEAVARIAASLDRDKIGRTASSVLAFLKAEGETLPVLEAILPKLIANPVSKVISLELEALIGARCREIIIPKSLERKHSDFAYVYGYSKKYPNLRRDA